MFQIIHSSIFPNVFVREDFPLLLSFFPKIHGKKSTCADKKILRLLLWSYPTVHQHFQEAKNSSFWYFCKLFYNL